MPALREKIVEIGGRPTAAGRARTRVLASDLLRERVAEYTCDGRLKVSELRLRAFGNATPAADVPEVDYAGVSEEDEMYASGREDGADEAKLLAARARKAAQWLLAQPPPPTACDAKGWAPREGDVHGRGARRCTLAVVTHQHLARTNRDSRRRRRRRDVEALRQRRAPRVHAVRAAGAGRVQGGAVG